MRRFRQPVKQCNNPLGLGSVLLPTSQQANSYTSNLYTNQHHRCLYSDHLADLPLLLAELFSIELNLGAGHE